MKMQNSKLVIIIEYKKIFKKFVKCYVPNWSDKVFVVKEVKNIVPWRYVINDIKSENFLECFMEKNFKKQIKKSIVLKK